MIPSYVFLEIFTLVPSVAGISDVTVFRVIGTTL